MKIRHQAIDHLKLETRCNEDVRGAIPGLQTARCAGRGFEQAQGGGAHGDHPPAAGLCLGDLCNRLRRELSALRMHFVIPDIIHLHRQEGPGAHMQGDVAEIDAPSGQRGKKLFIEMQTRRGRCHSTGPVCPYRLIVRLVRRICGAFGRDIGGQWHCACGLKRRLESLPLGIKGQMHLAILDPHHPRA